MQPFQLAPSLSLMYGWKENDLKKEKKKEHIKRRAAAVPLVGRGRKFYTLLKVVYSSVVVVPSERPTSVLCTCLVAIGWRIQ